MPPFAPFPGSPETGTLFIEVFGHLSGDTNLPSDEDLYSIFMARAELMSWSTHGTSSSSPRFAGVWERPLLWAMNEAGLGERTGASHLAYVQVGLEDGVEAAMVLPALFQCFDDALRRLGVVELSGLQVTASNLSKVRPCAGNLISALNWFRAPPNATVDALIAVDDGLLQVGKGAEFVTSLQRMYTGSFGFGPLVAVAPQQSIEVGWGPAIRLALSPAQWGVSVKLPEWTASAAAWALAMVIDTARVENADVRNFAVRVTRIR